MRNEISKHNIIKKFTQLGPIQFFGATFIAISPEHELSKKIFEKILLQKNLVINSIKLIQIKQKLVTTLTFCQTSFLEKKFQFSSQILF